MWTGYFETQSQKDFEDKKVPVSVSVNIRKVEVTNKNDMAGPAPPVRLVRFQPDHFSGQKYV